MSAALPPAPGLLIGLTAPAGSGKGLAGALLEAHYAFISFALADPILNMVCELALEADVGAEWAIERSLKEQPMPVLGRSYRELAQTLGDWGRNFEPDFWLRIAQHKLDQARVRGDNVCVLDIRYPNEAAWLRAQGGVLVAIDRPGVPPVRAHSSEQAYAQLAPEHRWGNGHTREHLLDQIDSLIAQLRAGVNASMSGPQRPAQEFDDGTEQPGR